MKALHCDSCDSWQRTTTHQPTFLTLSDHTGDIAHFCTTDCLMHWAAINSEPTEEIAP